MALVKPHGFHMASTVGESLDLAKDLLFGALLNGHDDPGVPRRAACKPE